MTMHDLLLEVSRRLPKILKDGSVVQMKHPVSYFLVPCCSSINGNTHPNGYIKNGYLAVFKKQDAPGCNF